MVRSALQNEHSKSDLALAYLNGKQATLFVMSTLVKVPIQSPSKSVISSLFLDPTDPEQPIFLCNPSTIGDYSSEKRETCP